MMNQNIIVAVQSYRRVNLKTEHVAQASISSYSGNVPNGGQRLYHGSQVAPHVRQARSSTTSALLEEMLDQSSSNDAGSSVRSAPSAHMAYFSPSMYAGYNAFNDRFDVN